jgi:HrpA-like RNA helicase
MFPVEKYENHIISAVKKFKLLIITAETGSGKTTFIPRILFKKGIFNRIVISQTRRIAAINAAKYVSELLNVKLGKEIGYTIRFENKSEFNTKIKFVTDGILFKEASEDPSLSKYECVILDEFHERTIYTDLLLSILKQSLIRRKEFNLIIMSASGECEKMAKFFGLKAGKINIPGRLFPIKIYHTLIPQANYIYSISGFIIKSHMVESIPGNFLVFLPGQEEIQKVEDQIDYIIKKKLSNFIILKFYSGMPIEEYQDIFKIFNINIRKIVLATNIAESSITIPGISLVIDSGFSKQKMTNWKTGIDLFTLPM